MRRGLKIAIAVLVALGVLLAVNAVVLDSQTKSAAVTVAGGRILQLPGGDVQVTSDGPLVKRSGGRPIVLVHCFACSLHWWDRVLPMLDRRHRVIRVDLLGFGGSEKPSGGYSIEDQGRLVALALGQLHVQGAVAVGHSMGFDVATALAAQSSELVDRLVNIDDEASPDYGGLPFLAKLSFAPVIGQGLWRVTPDFVVKDQYGSAFAPGFDVSSGFRNPNQVVDDFRAMTYTSYDSSNAAMDDYENAEPLDARVRDAAVPLLVVFGSEDQLYDDPRATAEAYGTVLGAQIRMIGGAGHSPQIEKPAQTARLLLRFAAGAGG